jgi:hypothetical protein
MRVRDVMHLERRRIGRAEVNWARIDAFGGMMVRMVVVVRLLWLLRVNRRSLALWHGRWGWSGVGHGLGH